MKVSELITKLQELQESHGDLEVELPCWEFMALHKVDVVEILSQGESLLDGGFDPVKTTIIVIDY